jgi:hypothetical protein
MDLRYLLFITVARVPVAIPGGIGFSEESAADILTAMEEICKYSKC